MKLTLNSKLLTLDYLHRWWQGMGFGIQSKTDYEYLKEVLKESLPYYAYSELPDRQSQLIYRVCLRGGKGKVAMVGDFTPTELRAASLATHGKAESLQKLTSAYLYDTIITKDLSILNEASNLITWNIKNKLGIIQRIPDRYPEHYRI